MSIAFNPRPRRPRFSPVACSPVLGALGAVDLAPSWFAEEDALEVCIARTARHRRAVSALLRWLTYAAAAVTAAVLLFVVGYILVRGVPALTPDLFQWEYTSENVSLLPALASTVIMALLALAMAVPVGVGAAIYLVEYARRGSRFVRLVRVTAETLQGIPSIIYGLFGMLCFSGKLRFGYSMLSGALTLAIMILPLIMRTTEEALLYQWVASLPSPCREEMRALYDEMAALETQEAQIYKALDKLEAVISHNESDISTWEDHEYDLQLTYGEQNVAFSPYLTALRQAVRQESLDKIAREGDRRK